MGLTRLVGSAGNFWWTCACALMYKQKLEKYLSSHFATCKIQVDELLTQLGEVDEEATKELLMALNRVTNEKVGGKMPPFSDPGARTGYIAKRFTTRGSYVGSLLLHEELEEVSKTLLHRPYLHIASVGGAAGNDFVGMLTWLSFLRSEGIIHDPLAVSCVVYDYEIGWRDSVNLLSQIVKQQLSGRKEFSLSQRCLTFSDCNVLENINDTRNKRLHEEIPKTNLYFFMYVLVENALGLQENSFSFLRDLFRQSQAGSIFIFMDSSWKLWSKIKDLASEIWGTNKITSYTPKHKAFGNTLVLHYLE